MIEQYVGDTLFYIIEKKDYVANQDALFGTGFLFCFLLFLTVLLIAYLIDKHLKHKQQYLDSLDDKNYRKYQEYYRKV